MRAKFKPGDVLLWDGLYETRVYVVTFTNGADYYLYDHVRPRDKTRACQGCGEKPCPSPECFGWSTLSMDVDLVDAHFEKVGRL